MFDVTVEHVEKLAAKKNVEKLTKLVSNKNPAVRLAAIDGLGVCGTDDAYNALISLIRVEDADARAHAVRALGKAGKPSARAHLEHQMKTEKDPGVNKAISEALSVLHGKD